MKSYVKILIAAIICSMLFSVNTDAQEIDAELVKINTEDEFEMQESNRELKQDEMPQAIKEKYNLTDMQSYSSRYTDADGIVYSSSDKIQVVAYVGTKTSITIPNTVISINNYAFRDNDIVKKVHIPSSVEAIGYAAFLDCYTLEEVTGGDGLLYVGSAAFRNATNLKTISCKNITSIYSDGFYGCESLESIDLGTALRSIGNEAFSGVKSLKNITLPDTLTSIGYGAFSKCSSLVTMVIPDSVTNMQMSYVLGLCTSLETVYISKNITSIPSSTFSGCSSLTEVTFGGEITSLGQSVFSGCVALKSYVIPNTVTSLGIAAFSGCTNLETLLIPASVEHDIQFKEYLGLIYKTNATILCYLGTNVHKQLVNSDVSYKVLSTPAITEVAAQSYGANDALISYSHEPNAEGYLIYGRRGPTASYGYIGMTKNNYFVDTKAIHTDYNFYWVFAYNYDLDGKMIAGETGKYVYAKGVCGAVTNLKASSKTSGVELSWDASREAEGYLIYGIRPGGSYGYIGMTTTGTKFTDTKADKVDYNFYWIYPYHMEGQKMIVGLTGKYTYGRAL